MSNHSIPNSITNPNLLVGDIVVLDEGTSVESKVRVVRCMTIYADVVGHNDPNDSNYWTVMKCRLTQIKTNVQEKVQQTS